MFNPFAIARRIRTLLTASNFVPTSNTVAGWLEGIDTKIGTLTLQLTPTNIDDTDSPVTGAVSTRYYATTTSGVIVLNLPATPANDSVVELIDVAGNFGTNAVTINPTGGDTIEGGASFSADLDWGGYTLRYNTAAGDWVVVAEAGVGAGIDTTAVHTDTAAEISAITEKTSPVDGDWLLIEDSEAGDAKKKVQVGNISTQSNLLRLRQAATRVRRLQPRAGTTTFGSGDTTQWANTSDVAATKNLISVGQGQWVERASSSVSGNSAYLLAGDLAHTRFSYAAFFIRADTDITSQRIWAGIFDVAALLDEDNPDHTVGFRFSTVAADTKLLAYANDGSATGQVADDGPTFTADTTYLCLIEYTGSEYKFYINDTEYTRTGGWTQTPTAGTDCDPVIGCTTQVAAARAILEQGFEIGYV